MNLPLLLNRFNPWSLVSTAFFGWKRRGFGSVIMMDRNGQWIPTASLLPSNRVICINKLTYWVHSFLSKAFGIAMV